MSSSSTASSSERLEGPRGARPYLAVVLCGALAVLAVTELLLRLLVTPMEEGWAHRVDLVYRGRGGDVVLGDSHTFRGFVTQDEFVNLSSGGSSVQAMEIVAREYFRHRDPGRVIIAASPQLFTRYRERAGVQQHDQYFGQNLGLPFQLYVFEPGVARHLGELLDPTKLIDRRRKARKRQDPRNRIDAFLQENLVRAGRTELTRLSLDVIRKNRPLPRIDETQAFAAYVRLVQRLLERGARVCMLRTAVIPRVEDLTSRDDDYQGAHDRLRGLAGELGVRYVDYRELGIDFRTEMFIDPDHLTAKGGDLFSQRAIQACFGEQREPESSDDS